MSTRLKQLTDTYTAAHNTFSTDSSISTFDLVKSTLGLLNNSSNWNPD